MHGLWRSGDTLLACGLAASFGWAWPCALVYSSTPSGEFSLPSGRCTCSLCSLVNRHILRQLPHRRPLRQYSRRATGVSRSSVRSRRLSPHQRRPPNPSSFQIPALSAWSEANPPKRGYSVMASSLVLPLLHWMTQQLSTRLPWTKPSPVAGMSGLSAWATVRSTRSTSRSGRPCGTSSSPAAAQRSSSRRTKSLFHRREPYKILLLRG